MRIELWGDTITDLRFFDADSQRSIEKVQSAEIIPVSKFIRDEKLIDSFCKSSERAFKSFFGKIADDEKSFFLQKYDELKELLSENLDFEGIEYYETILNPEIKTFLELLPSNYTVVFDEYGELKSKYAQIDNNLKKNMKRI